MEYGLHDADVLSGECAYSAGGVRKYYFFCIYANIFSKSLHFPRIHPKIPLAPAHFAIFMD